MPINTAQVFPSIPKVSGGKLLTANTAKDGTGDVLTVFTAGASGAKIDHIKIRSLGTNVATVVRFFINNGSTNEDSENNTLIHETSMNETTVSENESLPDKDVIIRRRYVAFCPIPYLPAGYKINVTTGTTLVSGLHVSVSGWDYDEVGTGTPVLGNNMIRLTVDDNYIAPNFRGGGGGGWLGHTFNVTSTGDVTVDWGDGTFTTRSLGGQFSKLYTNPQGDEKTILITSTSPITRFVVRPDTQGFKTAEFTTEDLTSGISMFSNCALLSLVVLPNSLPNCIYTNDMFFNCVSLNSINISSLTGVTNAGRMFGGCTSLTSVVGLSSLSNITIGYNMFAGTNLVSIDLSSLVNLTNISEAFLECASLETINISGLTNVGYATDCIKGCSSLRTLDATSLGSAGDGVIFQIPIAPFDGINTDAFLDFTDAKFAETIPDEVYLSLPVRSSMGTPGTGELVLTGVFNLGNYSLATGRNWLVTI